MSHTVIGPQLRGQVDQLGGEIWEDAQKGQGSDMETNVNVTQNNVETPRHTSSVSGKNVIQQSVCCELSNILRGNVFVEGLQLCLTLIELLVVTLKTNIQLFSKCVVRVFNCSNGQTVKTNHLFQSDACVTLIHFHREFSPNSLNLEKNNKRTTVTLDLAVKRQC